MEVPSENSQSRIVANWILGYFLVAALVRSRCVVHVRYWYPSSVQPSACLALCTLACSRTPASSLTRSALDWLPFNAISRASLLSLYVTVLLQMTGPVAKAQSCHSLCEIAVTAFTKGDLSMPTCAFPSVPTKGPYPNLNLDSPSGAL